VIPSPQPPRAWLYAAVATPVYDELNRIESPAREDDGIGSREVLDIPDPKLRKAIPDTVVETVDQ
jgi:hypothetical protein